MAKKKRRSSPHEIFKQAVDEADHLRLRNGLAAVKRGEGKGQILAKDSRQVLGSADIDGDCLQAAPNANRWDYVISQLAVRENLLPKPRDIPTSPVPRPSGTAELILVQAPVLRTRIQPGAWFGRRDAGDAETPEKPSENHFARDILDHLAASPSFLQRLRRFGAGGDLVPVVFPRPGANWYRQHNVRYHQTDDGRWERHGATPQISVFVMLVRSKPGAIQAALFDQSRRGQRDIMGAFIAELDFAIEPPDDPVHEIVIVGPRRDLEERWDFFLSGL